jgi:hypothetical protein
VAKLLFRSKPEEHDEKTLSLALVDLNEAIARPLQSRPIYTLNTTTKFQNIVDHTARESIGLKD